MKNRWSNKKFNLWPMSHKSLMREYEKLDKKYQFFFNKIKKKKLKFLLKQGRFYLLLNL
jgi:hypothetical protein